MITRLHYEKECQAGSLHQIIPDSQKISIHLNQYEKYLKSLENKGLHIRLIQQYLLRYMTVLKCSCTTIIC